jgi:hypothetical protein
MSFSFAQASHTIVPSASGISVLSPARSSIVGKLINGGPKNNRVSLSAIDGAKDRGRKLFALRMLQLLVGK